MSATSLSLSHRSLVPMEHLGVLNGARTLLRIVKIDSALPSTYIGKGVSSVELKKQRDKVLLQVSALWEETVKKLSESFLAASTFFNKKLQRLSPKVSRLYESGLILKSEEDVIRLSNLFQRDKPSVLVSPIKNSNRGNKGPTFLVSYSRNYLDELSNKLVMNSYIIKWTGWNEFLCNRIYDAFSKNFEEDAKYSYGFYVPKAAEIDFERRVHEKPEGTQVLMEERTSDELEGTFSEISHISNPDVSPKNRQVMLSERIWGENLLDFAISKYKSLTMEQKEKLFTRLAELAMLDIFMGNLDRIIQIYFNSSGEYVLADLETNLGNVMVYGIPKREVDLKNYAIDNEIDMDLIFDPEKKAKYIGFLKSILSNPDFYDILVNNMVASIRYALNSQLDDALDGYDHSLIEEVRANIDLFKTDIKEIAPEFFKLGLGTMKLWLKEDLIPSWNKAEILKNQVEENLPLLVSSIDERLQLLMKME
jgi:hypothetical protein